MCTCIAKEKNVLSRQTKRYEERHKITLVVTWWLATAHNSHHISLWCIGRAQRRDPWLMQTGLLLPGPR